MKLQAVGGILDANLRPSEEKWMLRTPEIFVGSLVYLLRTVSGSDQGLEFFSVRLVYLA